jgi:hypothetical protein
MQVQVPMVKRILNPNKKLTKFQHAMIMIGENKEIKDASQFKNYL